MFNDRLIEEYKSYCETHLINTGIIEAKDLEIKFDQQIENYTNKIPFIKNQIRKVDVQIVKSEMEIPLEKNNTLDFFLYAFNEYSFNNKEVDLSFYYDFENLIAIINGKNLAQYKSYLEEELNKALEKSKYKSKMKDISVTKQYLMLDYLGVLKDITANNNATKTGEFLRLLFNKTEREVRDKVKTFDLRTSKKKEEKLKVKKDLEAILPLFEMLKLKDHVERIKSDIAKLGL